MFILDETGVVVFFNEPAEAMLGRTYSESGEMSGAEWRRFLAPEASDGRPLPLEELPSAIAFRERRPTHGTLTILGLDGVRREISATGLPLFARGREFVGVISIFWERDGGTE